MKRLDILSALLIQVIENLDHEGGLISYQERREADQFLEGDRAGKPSEAISKRAQALMKYLQVRAPLLCKLSFGLTTLSSKFIWCLIGLGLLLGFAIHSLGEGRYFHLLSPILLGLLLWNFFSFSVLVWSTFKSRRLESNSQAFNERVQAGQKLEKDVHSSFQIMGIKSRSLLSVLQWLQAKWFGLLFKNDEQAQLKQTIALKYIQRLLILNREQIDAELRRSLHLMSISFFIGISLSAYWDGLIHEYQASAESTFLGREQIETLLNYLLYPSTYFGLGSITLEQFTDQNPQKLLLGPAAIWVHRYVISLLVWIVLPRCLLVIIESLKIWRCAQNIPLKLAWMEPINTLNIALASHTNIGKTSLARTLLKRDVGEVKNEKHVTRARASYFLLQNKHLRVRLWDTPGFGDLRSSDQLHSKYDHLEYNLEQEAIQALQEEADVIFYLVPARPSNQQKKQVKNELTLIAQAGVPIIIMINRLYDGLAIDHDENRLSLIQVKEQVNQFWSVFLQEKQHFKQVQSVLILDAFERSYQDEQAIFKALAKIDLGEKNNLSQHALELWSQNLDTLFEALAFSLSRHVRKLLELSVVILSGAKKEKQLGQEQLTKRSEKIIKDALDEVLDHIGLEGQLREEIFENSLESSLQQPERKERRKWGAIIGGAISGLGTGVAADIMSGGLSLGGGMIVGAVLGAIGGVGVIEGYDYINEAERELGLSLDAVYMIHQKILLFTIAASTHGRAQGVYHQELINDIDSSNSPKLSDSLIKLSKSLHKQRHLEIHQLIDQKYKGRQIQLFDSLRMNRQDPQAQHEVFESYKQILKESLMSI